MSEAEILKGIYDCLRDAEKKLRDATELMKKRSYDREMEHVNKQGARAGWSRFLAQMNQYVNQYGVAYLKATEDVHEETEDGSRRDISVRGVCVPYG